MNLIETLIGKLQNHPKRFVFTDGEDARVLQAARQIVTRQMGAPMLIGDRARIKDKAAKLGIVTKGIRIIEPERSSELDQFVEDLKALPKYSNLSDEEIRQTALDPNVFATLMLKRKQANALIAGATDKASSALRPLFQIIGTQEGVKTASSLLVIDMEAKNVGIDGTLFMGDCGVIPEPTEEQLADIAITTASLAHHLTDARPKVAMLSYSTHGNPRYAPIAKIQAATKLAREKAKRWNLETDIEGDIQIDAALDRATAHVKGIEDSPVAGDANVLVFPDLNSGNIASKLIHILSGANKYGQIIMGLEQPAADISRGATAHDILGAAAIVGCQAIDHRLLLDRQSDL
ncbi:MAG: phosphate acetyltransferase [Opitutales bacterium]|nr:phosphate acetyltransferase [Opitutales bacterium]MBT5170123.1 phosphate acetyltransferase [Opitutales bacterium]MBT5814024.1 phosphate acetyltransferase [Opitutales bacterium]MBT6768135.1 phosphate acetyltransferase [Opitutales bacterium]MDG2254711.1 phosphate acyltransferase [Opitutaceae bacterium]